MKLFKVKRSYFAEAGTYLHLEVLGQFRMQSLDEGAIELIKNIDFVRFRDQGFSICRAIRDSNGLIVKICDENKRKHMISVPDFVDYRKDIIIDLKTLHFSSAPDKQGLLITEYSHSSVLQGYENVTEKFEKYIESKSDRKYKTQFERYKKAYLKATGRVATLHVYIVPYAKVRN